MDVSNADSVDGADDTYVAYNADDVNDREDNGGIFSRVLLQICSPIKTIRNSFPIPTTTPTTPLSISPATSQSSSTQTAEPIVKCCTILEMGSHDLSPHAFGSGPQFWKGPQKGVLKNFFWTYFMSREGLIRSTKIQCKNLKFGMGVP